MNTEEVKRDIKKSKKDKQNNTVIPVLSDFYATAGDLKGEIKLFWEPVKNANTYAIQRSIYRKEKLIWHYVDIVDKSSYIDTGLKSGKSYYYRIAVITTKGQGDWSKPVLKKAL